MNRKEKHAPAAPFSPKKPLIPTAPGAALSLSDEKQYVVSSSPHVAADEGTRSIMFDVIIALVPTLCLSVYYFGWRSLMLTLECTALCVAFEWLWCRLMKKPQPVGDLSAVVTGMLIAFNMPATVPYYVPVVACAFASIVVKQLYGGIGKNFMNPALAGRVFVFLCFTRAMASFPQVFSHAPVFGEGVDVVTSATPLSVLKRGALPEITLTKLLIGQHGGVLGETGTVTLLAGGLYLMLRRVISPRIPLCYLGTVALLCYLFPKGGVDRLQWMLYQLCSGGLMLGALFMATDYVTSPVTGRGRILYGIGCGALTVLFRYF
ncbi:MAG: RnfABCDGE type electron transport complex subunit D, partial [Firmicutes bacterium]|nr:RnfABCDGE type electron transport complex subunit D [Bacillota bacterium]